MLLMAFANPGKKRNSKRLEMSTVEMHLSDIDREMQSGNNDILAE